MKKFFLLLAAGLIPYCAASAAGNSSEMHPDSLAVPAYRALDVRLGIDLVSSYVCRGKYLAGPSFQPSFEISWGGLFAAAWGSIDFTGSEMREADLTIGYRTGRFEVAVTDYYVVPLHTSNGRFFDYGRQGPHSLEAILSWTVHPRVPIGLWWGTTFAGADIGDDGRRNFSTYAEISYPFTVRRIIDFKTGVGCMPWSTENCYDTRGFAVTNIYLHATTSWTLSRNLRIGLLARLICNPYREQFNFVGGITFHI